ncbi:MAG: hypothetical protein Q8L85_00690 [Alphaproteobacteria bacterium]|nr:hypothetical protein [Alphaproteobacteria bacterium]
MKKLLLVSLCGFLAQTHSSSHALINSNHGQIEVSAPQDEQNLEYNAISEAFVAHEMVDMLNDYIIAQGADPFVYITLVNRIREQSIEQPGNYILKDNKPFLTAKKPSSVFNAKTQQLLSNETHDNIFVIDAVNSLKLEITPTDEELYKLSQKFPNVTSLNVDNLRLGRHKVNLIAEFFPQLTSFSASYLGREYSSHQSGEALAALSQMTNLTSLDISHTLVTDKMLETFLPHLTKLTSLKMQTHLLSQHGAELIVQHTANLKHLDVFFEEELSYAFRSDLNFNQETIDYLNRELTSLDNPIS